MAKLIFIRERENEKDTPLIKKAYEIPNGDYLIIDSLKFQKSNNDTRFVNVKPLFPTMFPRGGVIYALDEFKKINKNVWRKL